MCMRTIIYNVNIVHAHAFNKLSSVITVTTSTVNLQTNYVEHPEKVSSRPR